MSSIRLRLFATLALVTALVWGGAVVWVEIQTRAEVQRVLDRRLMESARMVSSLMQAGSVRPAMQAPESGAADVYDRQLSCQIWSLEGDLIGRSQSAPAERLSEGGDGFSERTIRASAGASTRCMIVMPVSGSWSGTIWPFASTWSAMSSPL